MIDRLLAASCSFSPLTVYSIVSYLPFDHAVDGAVKKVQQLQSKLFKLPATQEPLVPITEFLNLPREDLKGRYLDQATKTIAAVRVAASSCSRARCFSLSALHESPYRLSALLSPPSHLRSFHADRGPRGGSSAAGQEERGRSTCS